MPRGVDSPLTGWGLPTEFQASLPLNNHSNGLEASRLIKSGPGELYGFTVYSNKASAQFIHVFDAASVPADGAVPTVIFTVAATSFLPVAWLPSRTFLYGIVLANSTTAATKTAGSADCFFDAQFV